MKKKIKRFSIKATLHFVVLSNRELEEKELYGIALDYENKVNTGAMIETKNNETVNIRMHTEGNIKDVS